jgi:iron complex outermembrane receptor protein
MNRCLSVLVTRHFLTALIAVGLTGTSLEAVAQPSGTIEEIVVTAQKREQGIQDAPLSVSALSSDDLAKLKLRDVTQIAAQIPNVQIATAYSESQPSFSIRGVTMSDWSQNQSSPVAMYVDDVYKGLGALQALQLFDLERIEVLRGPQGTLYGKNATGGAVSIVSAKPTMEAGARGEIKVGYGEYDLIEAEGMVEFASQDSAFGVRAAFDYASADGWVENNVPGRDDSGKYDEFAARVTFLYEPSDSFDAALRVSVADRDVDTGYEVLADDIGPGGVGFFTGYDRSGLNYFESEMDRDSEQSVENTSVSLAFNYHMNADLTLTSITAYDEGEWITLEDADGSPVDILEADYLSDVTSVSQEFRLASEYDGSFNFLAGVFVQREEVEAGVAIKTYHAFAGDGNGNGVLDCFEDFVTGCTVENSYDQEKDSMAAYLEGVFELSERLELTLGLRYSKDEVEVSDYNAALGYVDPDTGEEILGVFPTIVDVSRDVDDSEPTYRVVLDYVLSDNANGYLSFSTGFRNSAFNGQAFYSPVEVNFADPETVDSWEVGFKSDWLGNTLRVNGAVFHYKYEDQQFINVRPDFLQELVNAEEATIKGLELEVIALPVDNLELRFGIGYLDAEYDKLTLGGADLSGNDLIATPDLNANIMATWYFATNDAGSWYLSADAVYIGDQYYDAFNSEPSEQEGYWISNARLGFDSANSGFDFAIWAKNLADEEYTRYRLDLGANFNFTYAHRGRPRTVGIEATYRF